MTDFKANWSGGYPNLCFGEWTLEYQGLPLILPEDERECDKGTYGEYSSWHFEDWSEVFDSYEDGLKFPEWVKENGRWVDVMFHRHNIEKSEANYLELFEAFQENDWRSNSCGGCI